MTGFVNYKVGLRVDIRRPSKLRGRGIVREWTDDADTQIARVEEFLLVEITETHHAKLRVGDLRRFRRNASFGGSNEWQLSNDKGRDRLGFVFIRPSDAGKEST